MDNNNMKKQYNNFVEIERNVAEIIIIMIFTVTWVLV